MTEDNRRENIKEEYVDGLHFVEYLPEPEEQKISRADRRNMEVQKAWLVACLAVVIIVLVGTLAWYVLNALREIDSKDTEVMTPYVLYLLDPADEKSLALTVGNLHPGETKQAVICVSSKNPEGLDPSDIITISKDSEFSYELELAYTENLAVFYHVYELELVSNTNGDDATDTSSGLILVQDENGENIKQFKKAVADEETDTSADALEKETPDISGQRQKEMYGGSDEDREKIVNLGQYDLYQTDAKGQPLKLNTNVTTTTSGGIEYDKDYYLIEIQWKNDIHFDDYRKETDLVYVIVKAMQPKPEAATTQTDDSTE